MRRPTPRRLGTIVIPASLSWNLIGRSAAPSASSSAAGSDRPRRRRASSSLVSSDALASGRLDRVERVAGLREEAVDLAAEEAERDDCAERDDRDDQRVLDQPLA